MTPQNIIRMARKAGFSICNSCTVGDTDSCERFAALAVAHEREACLAEIEQGIWLDKTTSEILDLIASSIRARGQA